MAQSRPFFLSPRLSAVAVQAAMLALLAGALCLVWGLTAAPLLPPSAPDEGLFRFGDAAMELPAAWVFSPSASDPTGRKSGGAIAAWQFANTASPAEALRILRFDADKVYEPRRILGQLLPHLIANRRFKTTNGEGWRAEINATEAGETIEIIFSTERLTSMATAPRLHAVTLFTPDRRRFWVYQLTDQVPIERWDRNREVEHLQQLRELLKTVEYPRPGA